MTNSSIKAIVKEKENKINFSIDTYIDANDIWKFRNTMLPLCGIYEDEYGTIRHFENGKCHNEDGPAIIGNNGYKEYCLNNKIHRIDGPAAIYSDDEDYDWYINDFEIDKEIMDDWLKDNDIPLDWNIWTDSDKMLFALHWSDYNG